MKVAYLLAIFIGNFLACCEGRNCIWGENPPLLRPNSDNPHSGLSEFIGRFKVFEPANNSKTFPCRHSYHNSTSLEGVWDCEITMAFDSDLSFRKDLRSLNLRILQCGGGQAKCAENSFCEDNYCIHSCSSDPECSAGTASVNSSSEDCILSPNCFISLHWTQNPSCVFGCTRDENCFDDEACIFNRCKRCKRCKSPCHSCGANSECRVLNHKPICTCVNGTTKLEGERGCGQFLNQTEARKELEIESCSKVDDHGRDWSVDLGAVGIMLCPSLNSSGIATWECRNNGEFATLLPNYTNCTSHWVDQVVADSVKIVGEEETLIFFEKLANDTADESKIGTLYFGVEIPKIVNATLTAISNVKYNTTFNELSPIVTKALESSDNLLKSKQQWNQLAENDRLSVLTELTNSIENTAILLAKTFNETGNGTKPQTDVQVLNTATITVNLGTTVLGENSTTSLLHVVDEQYSESQTKVEVDYRPSVNFSANATVKYVSIFLDGKTAQNSYQGALTPNSTGRRLINGKVIFVTLFQSGSNNDASKPRTEQNTQFHTIHDATITVTFQHDYNTWGSFGRDIRRRCGGENEPSAVLGSGVCSYWDHNNLTWSTEGCEVVKSTATTTTCRCNHLSTFSVLMTSHNYIEEDNVLEYITLIFCSLSAISLLLTITAFSVAKSGSRDGSVITKHLSIYLMLGNVLLIFAVGKNVFTLCGTPCTIAGILSHFVYTNAFMWMAVEGWHIYGMLFRIGKEAKMTLTGYKILCPLVSFGVVGVTFAVGYWIEQEAYGNEAVCWINDGFIWGFNGLVAAILLVNFVVLGLTMHLSYNRGNRNLTSTKKKTDNRKWIVGSFFLTTLLGGTWIFGYFMLLPGLYGHAAEYVFTIFTATQGIFIFFYYCAMDANVRSDLAQLYSRYKTVSGMRFTTNTL